MKRLTEYWARRANTITAIATLLILAVVVWAFVIKPEFQSARQPESTALSRKVTTPASLSNQVGIQPAPGISASRIWKVPNAWTAHAINLGYGPTCLLAIDHAHQQHTLSFAWHFSSQGELLQFMMIVTDNALTLPDNSQLDLSIDGYLIGQYQAHHTLPKGGLELASDLPNEPAFGAQLLKRFAEGEELTIKGNNFLLEADLPGKDVGPRLVRETFTCLTSQ